ncbi:MAG: hypothetical protein V4490_02905 [Pseudomonadota bacterium]
MNFIYFMQIILPLALIAWAVRLFRSYFKNTIDSIIKGAWIGVILSGPLTCYYKPLIFGPMNEMAFLEMIRGEGMLTVSMVFLIACYMRKASIQTVFIGFFALGLTIGYWQRFINDDLKFNFGDATLLLALAFAVAFSAIYFICKKLYEKYEKMQ